VIDFDARVAALIDACARDLADGRDWRQCALDLHVRTALAGASPAAFLDWARGHRRWSFAVAEAAGEVCAKPPEAAAYVLLKIAEEALEERGLTA
jgi:hypothetical protein